MKQLLTPYPPFRGGFLEHSRGGRQTLMTRKVSSAAYFNAMHASPCTPTRRLSCDSVTRGAYAPPHFMRAPTGQRVTGRGQPETGELPVHWQVQVERGTGPTGPRRTGPTGQRGTGPTGQQGTGPACRAACGATASRAPAASLATPPHVVFPA